MIDFPHSLVQTFYGIFELPGSSNESSVSVPDVQQTDAGAPNSASSAVVIAANGCPDKANLEFDGVIGDVAKKSLTAGGLPTIFGISDSERTLAPAGLGEGSPKVR